MARGKRVQVRIPFPPALRHGRYDGTVRALRLLQSRGERHGCSRTFCCALSSQLEQDFEPEAPRHPKAFGLVGAEQLRPVECCWQTAEQGVAGVSHEQNLVSS